MMYNPLHGLAVANVHMDKLPEIVGYARVSSVDQAKNSNALEQQIARLKSYGLSTVLVDIESGRQGKEDKRTEYQKIMQGVKDGIVKKIVVTRLDRFSRSVRTFKNDAEYFFKYGCNFVALDNQIDMSTPVGKFHVTILAGLAEHESDSLAQRVNNGKNHFRNQKRASHPPLGYIVRDFKYFIDDKPFLCLIKNKKEYSKQELAEYIVNYYLQHKSLTGTCRDFQDTFGYLEFWPSGLRLWLLSPTIQGHLVYYPKSKNPTIHYNNHPPLISRETFLDIQQIMLFNHKVGGYGHRRGVYSLTGLVKCSCGSGAVIANGLGGAYKYFVCAKARLKSCTFNKGVRLELLEDAVIQALIKRSQVIASQVPLTSVPQESTYLTELKERLKSWEQVVASTNIAMPGLENDIANLRLEIEAITQNKSESLLPDNSLYNILKQTYDSPQFWRLLNLEGKQKYFRLLVDHALISNGSIQGIVLKV